MWLSFVQFLSGSASRPIGRIALAFLVIVAITRPTAATEPGTLSLYDPSANTSLGAGDDVFALARGNNEQLYIVGQFLNYAGVSRGRLARLNANATLDLNYFAGTGADNSIYSVAVQADGRVLIAGAFQQVHGQSRPYLARLDSTGQLDSSFAAGLTINNELRIVAVEPDGRILIAGRFTNVGGQSRNRIARLNSDGSLDATFNPGTGANDNIRALLRLGDGRILIGGQFTNYNNVSRSGIARLLSTGALDLTFDPGRGTDDQVRAVATNQLGQIYIGGDFEIVNGTNRSAIARLNPNGSLDLSFDQGDPDNDTVRAIEVQPDGKVWIGGSFVTAGGLPRVNLARLNTNGLADDFFDPFPTVNSEVFALAFDPSNRLWIGGKFTRVDETLARRLARLAPANTNTSFVFDDVNTGIPEESGSFAIAVRRMGAIGPAASTQLVSRDGTAVANADYLPIALSLNFAPGQRTNSVPITVIDDPFPEGDEFFEVELRTGLPSSLVTTRQYWILDNEFQDLVDPNFNPAGLAGLVKATALQPDGKIIVGGGFPYIGGCLATSLGRLNTNGAPDCDFVVNSQGADGAVNSVQLLPNGQILAGGDFRFFNSVPSRYLVRLNSNGVTDSSFQGSASFDGPIYALRIQPDGRILIGGAFTHYGATPRAGLARLQADGQLDTSFAPTVGPDGTNGVVRAIHRTAFGQIVIAGDFTTVNGVPRPRLARLNTNGSIDATFNPGAGPDGGVFALAEHADGRLVIAGDFTHVGNVTRDRVARFHTNGLLDQTLNIGSLNGGPRLHAVAVQPDNKIVLGGLFQQIGTSPRSCLARVHENGQIDPGFLPSSGANGEVQSIQVLADGRLLAAGSFTVIAGQPRLYLALLNSDTTTNRLEFANSNYPIWESAGSLGIPVRRIGISTGTVSVAYATIADTASAEQDFQPVSGRVTFAPYETSKTIAINILNDGLVEGSEQFRVRLTDPQGDASLGNKAETSVEILDNDFGFTTDPPELKVREGNGTVEILVRRNSDAPESTTVRYATVDGTATGGSDYDSVSGTLIFGPNETQKTVTIPIRSNPEFEGSETFRLVLSNPGPGTDLGLIHESTIAIEDQDGEFGLVILSDTGEGGSLRVLVTRAGTLELPATVRIHTVAGTALPGVDFTPIDRVLEFAPFQSHVVVDVEYLNDGLVEGPETFRLVLDQATGNSTVGNTGDLEFTIVDNDRGIEFTEPTFYVNEFSPSARILVRRGDDWTNALTVGFTTIDGTALSGHDYMPTSGVVVLPPFASNVVINIPIRSDLLLEPSEYFDVALTSVSPGGMLGSQITARVYILDDERAGSLDVSYASLPATEWPYKQNVTLGNHSGGQLLVGLLYKSTRRLRDGSLDATFDPPVTFFMAPQYLERPDHRILEGGSSSNGFGSQVSSCLRLLETNGTEITTFSFPFLDGRTATMALQLNGLILAGGDYAIGPFGLTNRPIVRVLPDSGQLDPTFDCGPFDRIGGYTTDPSTVENIAIQPDGKILAVGLFGNVAGQSRSKIVRLLNNGAVDPTFIVPKVLPESAPQGSMVPYFRRLALQADGRIVVGGVFTNIGGTSICNVARYLPNGGLDPTFSSPLTPERRVTAVALQPDGKILVAGYVIGPDGFNVIQGFVYRLLTNGQFDPTFEQGNSPDDKVTALVMMPGGDIMIGGPFERVNGIRRPLFARLRGDGLRLESSPSSPGFWRKQLFNTTPGGVTVLESSEDLTHWFPFLTNVAAGAAQEWVAPTTGPRQFIRALHTPNE